MSNTANTPADPAAATRLIQEAHADIVDIQSSQTRNIFLAVRAGIRLIAAKQACGHGNFASLLKDSPVSERSAQRYMKLAHAVRDQLALKPSETQLLLAAQPQLTEGGGVIIEARPTLSKKLVTWIDQRTLTEILQDLGIRRETRGSEQGGEETGAGEGENGQEDGEITAMENARSVWFGGDGKSGLMNALRIWGLQEKSFAHLSKPERQDILGALTDLTAQLKATL